jgi:transcriptional regulator with XRE-family HTH domain
MSQIMEIDKTGIAGRLKELRRTLGLTQKEFAEHIGRTLRAIQRYESGQRSPDETTLRLIEQTFSVNPEWLRHGKGEMFTKPKTVNIDELLEALGIMKPEDKEKLKDLIVSYSELTPEEKELYYHEIKAKVLRRKLEGKSAG